MLSVEFACIFRGNVAIGISSVKPPLRSDLNQLASLIPGEIHIAKKTCIVRCLLEGRVLLDFIRPASTFSNQSLKLDSVKHSREDLLVNSE
jgi:hypothetical protein